METEVTSLTDHLPIISLERTKDMIAKVLEGKYKNAKLILDLD